MNVGSLFSGVGGIDLGLERAGMEIKWQVENDSFCNKVLAMHWPNVKRYGDIKMVTGRELDTVDVICGGFPCQPVSVAGKRKGVEDARWLWPEYRRVVRQVKPRWVLVENVPGLLSMDSGRLFAGMLRDLSESGYDAEWDCIPAAAFGAPHLRYRFFIVAYSQRLRCNPILGRAQRGQHGEPSCNEPETCREAVANANGQRLQEQWRPFSIFEGDTPIEHSSWWESEPDVGRVAHGLPARVDRLRGLGNAVVPQVAEWLGRRIMEVEATQ